MSDVREQMRKMLYDMGWDVSDSAITDAILERFDVTPKPAVTAKALGVMVVGAHCDGEPSYEGQGERMFEQLAGRGLKIVRVDE
jgi:hypothetical protein